MISIASSIRFRKNDGLLPSFDNVMFQDQEFIKVAKYPFYHTVYATDLAVKIQAELELTQSMEMQYAECVGFYSGKALFGEYQSMTGETTVFTGAYYLYREISIDFSAFTESLVKFRAVITEGETIVETWESEPVEILTAAEIALNGWRYLQIEAFNLENKNHVYYTNPTEADRLSHLWRVKGHLRKYKPSGETSVFDNQNEVVKVADELKRVMTLETEPIPAYLAEQLALAMSLDKFYINEVEYVAEGKPEFDLGGGPVASLTVQLTQRDVIGLNAHDTGYDCDSITGTDMIVLQELAASGQKSFSITDDYMVLTITGERVAGSPTIIAGTTPGGSDLLSSMVLSSSYTVEVALVPTDKASITGGVLYVTVSGSGATANIYVNTIKNRQ